MGLADDLAGIENEPVGRLRCSVGLLLDALDGADADAVNDALGNPAVRPSALARVLRNNGHTISEQTIRRHRRRECRCPGDPNGA